MMNTETLESRIAFTEAKAKAARRMLDATYQAAEDGADHDVIQLMQLGTENVLAADWWQIHQEPAYSPMHLTQMF